MLQTLNTDTIRKQLLYDVKHSNPETLELFYNFVELLKKSLRKEKAHDNTEKHNLGGSFGVLTHEEGQEMIDCINNKR